MSRHQPPGLGPTCAAAFLIVCGTRRHLPVTARRPWPPLAALLTKTLRASVRLSKKERRFPRVAASALWWEETGKKQQPRRPARNLAPIDLWTYAILIGRD